MKLQFLFLCIYFCFSTQAQTTFTTGIVYDSIPVSGTNDQTFALYLPENYKEGALNSIVFIFDPAARAAIGIQPFMNASEEYGHILVCSNNSRNGPYDQNFDITNNLFDHIYSNFSIKQDEMYLSGFSGGSRLASVIATMTNKFTGVIACGGGFSDFPTYIPTTQEYAYVGLCGDRDMNYREMLRNKDYLDSKNFNSTLITYDGDHSWPPSAQISRAFDWLYLQKLKKTKSLESEHILKLYQSDYNSIAQFITNEDLLFASEQYERILKSYKGLVSVDSLVEQHRILLNTKAYKKQATALATVLTLERKLADKFITQITTDFKSSNSINFGWWEREFKRLNRLNEKSDVEMQKMVYRLKFNLYLRMYSKKNALAHDNNEDKVAIIEAILKLLYPK